MRVKAACFLVAVLLASATLPAALADAEVLRPGPSRDLGRILREASKYASGSVWAIFNELDPRFSRSADELFAQTSPSAAGPQQAIAYPYRSPSPRFSRNLLITRDLGARPVQTEPHIAVNPKDPDHLIVGAIDYNMASTPVYVSLDGGASWEGPIQLRYPAYALGTAGDPTVAFDRKGRAYAAYLFAHFEEFAIGADAFFAILVGTAVSVSEDGGFTWPLTSIASRGSISLRLDPGITSGVAGELALVFSDKPWMAVGPDPVKRDLDNVYAVYTQFAFKIPILVISINGAILYYFGIPVVETAIMFVKSSDGGRSWSHPRAISPTVRRVYGEGPGPQHRVVQGGNIAIAGDGNLYVAWFDSADDGTFLGRGEVWVARSTDGGESFLTPVRAVSFQEMDFAPRTHNFRVWASGFPQLAAGPRGTVYIAFTAPPPDKPFDDGDVYVVASRDFGSTWGQPVRVNDDETGRLQFFPAIAVARNGTIHVMFGDFRLDPFESSYHIFYSRSDDGGRTWLENSRVTDFPTNPNFGFPRGLFVGDYFSMAVADSDVYMVWSDARLGEFRPINQKIGFARLRPIPSPSVFLSPPSGPAGQEVVVQGSNFQPDSMILILINGVLVSSIRADSAGTFFARLFMPAAAEGAARVTAIDESGNTAEASFFVEFGFNTIEARLKAMLGELKQAVGQLGSSPRGGLEGRSAPLWLAVALGIGLAFSVSLSAFIYVRTRRLLRKGR